MKQVESSLKRQKYQTPRAEIINIETQTVLCTSSMQGNNTENVTIETFDF